MSLIEALWLTSQSEARPVTDLCVGLGACAGCAGRTGSIRSGFQVIQGYSPFASVCCKNAIMLKFNTAVLCAF